ncbi:PucR family transcriptional regulator [Cohnella algarum]|uniref:PucR family transcriptional regulator n=1 Tax=Cohnella algarum TaxID=2044859 RepID=UPI0019672603|nr:PucR family transcriptional regulator [Cohnella algarum]MBN2980037.1 PucR family transcriptional regulator [Cohnella algarum]
MQLQELLKLPVYRGARLLAGKGGAARQVKSVNMMDAPDIIGFLKPNDLLLTTGYAMRDKPEELAGLIRQMAENGCAGLGIKLKRFLHEIPQSALDLADELDFPLIELALEPSLGELLQASLSRMMEKHNEELHYAIDLHRDFSRMIMQGHGIAAVIQALSRVVEGTALLMNHRCETIFGSGPLPDAVFGQLREQSRRMLAGQPDSDAETVGLRLPADETEEGPEAFFYRIRLPQQTYFMVLVNAARMDGSPLPSLAVEQAANVIGFELMKQQAVRERTRRFKNEYFDNLVEGRFGSAAEILHSGKRYGLQDRVPYLCIAAQTDPGTGEADDSQFQKRDYIYERLKTMLSERKRKFVMFNKKERYVLLVEWERQPASGVALLSRELAELQESLFSADRVSLSFGIGNPAEQLTQIPGAFKEAANALELGYRGRQTRFVQIYRAKEVAGLLGMIPKEARRDFVAESFRPLANVEPGEREELLNTARAFLETQGQIAETAKRLYIHRNTVAYRMAKFEKLTGRSLRDPNDSLRLRLAFLLRELQ